MTRDNLRRSLLACMAFVILLWTPTLSAAQGCWYEVAVYADLYDSGIEQVDAYGAGWDGSYCPPCPHGYYLDVTATIQQQGGGASQSFNELTGMVTFSMTVEGWVDYAATLTVWCFCGGWMPPVYYGGSGYVQRPQACGDARDTIIAEYRNGGPGYPAVNWVPGCGDFSSGGGSAHFSWSELNHSPGSGHPPYGIVSIWSQLEDTRTNHGNVPITIHSGYRCPHGNHAVGGAGQSRHMWGDAADMSTGNWGQTEWDLLRQHALQAGFTWYEPYDWDPSHLHVDRR